MAGVGGWPVGTGSSPDLPGELAFDELRNHDPADRRDGSTYRATPNAVAAGGLVGGENETGTPEAAGSAPDSNQS